ncbi:GNAT family N-acetyltransferase [Paraclostridium bifermentans]|uniref:GNAT family N-acetyltransferase n=1 Tax=Paraclostridium bifermentans TaxID=1490 RepID=UPI001FF586D0|nr:GNAT family N-acetyltransferase [Paraclostridium bifermentans]UOW66784.1 GNAT family N-acetyltransferase [Paraclostridium bifermentans]
MAIYYNSKDIDTSKVKDFYCNYATWKVSNKLDDWEKIIEKSSCIVTCWDNDILIGMARALSDEVRWATVIDVLVHPSYRGQSIGRNIIERLLKEREMQVRTIYLATPDKEKFYNNLGFKTANEHCSYMIKVQNTNEDDYILPAE